MLCIVFCYLLLAVSPLTARRINTSSGRTNNAPRYPHSNGLSGNTNTYNSGHTYPHSTGLSGSYGSQQGTNTNRYANHQSTNNNRYATHHVTNNSPQIHHHYHYNPPQHISYGATRHPVYHGTPPVYVYEYRNSGSRYDSLLTGLALYNLGRMSSGRHDHYNPDREYRGTSGEICKMRIERSRVEYEEAKIDCRLISSFILEGASETQNVNKVTVQTSTVNVNRSVSENGTVVSTTVQNTTVVDAIGVKGPSVQLTSGMQCFVIRISRYSSDLKIKVDCGLLQEYSRSSLRYNDSNRLIPEFVMYVVLIFIFIWNYC